MAADGTRRGPWVPKEDARLRACISAEGPQNWVAIAQAVGNRSAKQCRERYHQNLKPGLNPEPITRAEAEYILEQVRHRGPRWADISRELGNGRSDNAVKNWWNGHINREKRQQARQAANRNGDRPTSRGSSIGSSRGRLRESQRHYSHIGPAPLPSPTDSGFSPRPRETSVAWHRDQLPPSPSSITSEQSFAHTFPASASRIAPQQQQHQYQHQHYTYTNSESARSPHYHPAATDMVAYIDRRVSDWTEQSRSVDRRIGLPNESGNVGRCGHDAPMRNLNGDFQRHSLHEPDGIPGGDYRNPRTSLNYQTPRSEQPPTAERQYYHSHQLPPLRQLDAHVGRMDTSGFSTHSAPPENTPNEATPSEVAAPRTRDVRITVASLMD